MSSCAADATKYCVFVSTNVKYGPTINSILYNLLSDTMKCTKCHDYNMNCKICGANFKYSSVFEHIYKCRNVKAPYNVMWDGFICVASVNFHHTKITLRFPYFMFVKASDEAIYEKFKLDDEFLSLLSRQSYSCIFCGLYYESPPSYEVLYLHLKKCLFFASQLAPSDSTKGGVLTHQVNQSSRLGEVPRTPLMFARLDPLS